MNLPSLPSDSLYKFISFFGMSLVLISMYFLFSEERMIDQKVLDLNSQNRQIDKKDSLTWKEARAIQTQTEFLSKRLGIANPFSATDTSYSWKMTYKGSKEEELLSDTIRALVQKFNEKESQIAQMRVDSRVNEYIFDELQKNYSKDQIIFSVLAFIGILISMGGFRAWYINIQQPTDRRTKSEALLLPPIASRCQSCGKKFEHYTVKRGTESDGHQNNFFCSECYDKGQFVEPEVTLAIMETRLDAELEKERYRKYMKKRMIGELKTLQRWNTERKYE